MINGSQMVSFSSDIPVWPPQRKVYVWETLDCISVCSAHRLKGDDVSVFSLFMWPNN